LAGRYNRTSARSFYIMPVSNSRYDLLHKRLQRFTQMLHGIEKGRARSVHGVRVASRRLREVLPVLQLDRDLAGRLGRRLRKVTHRLGTVRELDVLFLLVEEFQESGSYDERALARLASAIAEERSVAHDRLSARLPIAQLQRLADKLDRITDDLVEKEKPRTVTRGWRWAIEARVAHRAAPLKAAIEAAGTVYLPERVHDVRIAMKKLRYSIELEAEISSMGSWRRDLTLLKRTQALLGHLRDREVLIERVRQVQASLTPPDLVVWRSLDSLVATIEKECRRLHARYVRDAATLIALCDRVVGRTPAAPRAQRAG
jgi:CHAD domain-containing protein